MAPPRLLLLVLLLIPAAAAAAAATGPLYTAHCAAPGHAADLPDGGNDGDGGGTSTAFIAHAQAIQLSTGYFSGGGERLFGPDPSFLPRTFSLLPTAVRATADAALLHVAATLSLSGGRRGGPYRNRSGRFLAEYESGRLTHSLTHRPRLPRFVGRRGSLAFDLDGYYSLATGELCMVGSGAGRAADGAPVALLPAVLRLRFPVPKANLTSPFVAGRLETTSPSPGVFEPVALLAYAEDAGYAYAESASCPQPPAQGIRDARNLFDGGKSFSCGSVKALLKTGFMLDYGSGNGNSTSSASSLGISQRYMFVNRMQCAADGAVRAYVVFSNRSDFSRYYFMVGEKAMVAEGYWDPNASRLCLKGCHVRTSGPSRADLAVGECGVGMSFWFPGVWSLQERSFAAGLVWNATSLNAGEQGVVGRSTAVAPSFRGNFAGMKYNYTKVDEAMKYYYKESGLNKKRKGKFPDSNSYRDLAFRFYLKKGGGSGYASPITIGSMLYDGNSLVVSNPFSQPIVVETKHQRLLNVSYDIRYVGNWSIDTFERQHIAAEGVYDTETGSLCLIACRQVVNVLSSDCQMLVTAQFASLDSKVAQHVQGKITSLRKKTDPLFFETLDLASYGMYVDQVEESIWRMDLESTMALISMTLSCVFIIVQLFHVKRTPEALPAMSITMLVLLALGYMTPLVLNFEALFKHSNKQTVQFSDGGWLEVNEVMVRIITMVTFLLQLRLLQLAWSARSVDGNKLETWAAERKVLWICLPLYIIGGVVASVVHMRLGHSSRRMLRGRVSRVMPAPHAYWEDLVSYGGLLLDGFLLPQVILNVFSASKVRALSKGFYIGSTLIRALPHVYDVFRSRHFMPSLRPSFLYARPHDDLFSLAWDIVIPSAGVLLAALIFFQQRLGGAFLLCSRTRRTSSEYEMVSTTSS